MANMKISENFEPKYILYSIGFILCLIFVKYHWNRRWLYYHALKIPGLYPLPIIGSAHKLLIEQEDLYQTKLDVTKTQPAIYKTWIGPALYIITSRPRDLDIILSKCLDRGSIIKFYNPAFGDGLLTADSTKWTKNRKVISSTFNSPTLHSFISDFNKHSKILVQKLQNNCSLESFDILLDVFCCAIDTTCETLLDVDASLATGKEKFIKSLFKTEKLAITRTMKIWYYYNFIWKYSSKGKEMESASKVLYDFVQKIIKIKKTQINFDDYSLKKKCFLNHLINKSESNFDNETILNETQTMLIASSETQAFTISMILLILGIYPKIQEKVYKEIITVVGDNQDEITSDHINQMIYLDAVIKEVLKLFPTVPVTLRDAQKDIELDDYTIPAGSHIIIPIFQVHKLPEYWKNPEAFNPDRFLFKETENLPPCVYMPFSYGRRNCIGYKYALLFMKVILSTLLKHYKFESVDYKSIEEIEFILHIVAEPRKGYKVKIQKRDVL